MKSNYKLNQRLIAYILLVILFLQSCGSSFNQLAPKVETFSNHTTIQRSTHSINIDPLKDQELSAERGYLVTFYEGENGMIRADVRADKTQREPNYKNLPVRIEEGTDLTSLIKLDSKIQQSRIQLKLPQSVQSGCVSIFQAALLGGMQEESNQQGQQEQEPKKEGAKISKKKRKSRRSRHKTSRRVQEEAAKVKGENKKGYDSTQVNNQQGEKQEKEKEKGDEGQSAGNDLLKRARKGEAKAQFKLGKKLYNLWKNSGEESVYAEAIKWLNKAVEQGHPGAVNLLEKIKAEKDNDFASSFSSNSNPWRERNFNTSFPSIDPESIQYIEEIGDNGGMGKVFSAIYQGDTVAVKSLYRLTNEQIAAFKKEAMIIANLKHPNIINFLGFFKAPEVIYRRLGPFSEQDGLMMEYAPNSSLWSLLKSHKKDSDWDPSWQLRYQIALDVAKGLDYLHQWDIVHCDLKGENILLDSKCRAKIADFGTAALKTENSTYGEWTGGTLRWMAPEIFHTNKNSKAGDVYSYGMILWQLGSRKEPFASIKGLGQIMDHVKAGNKENIIDYKIPLVIKKIIQLCWRSESKRPGMQKVRHLLGREANLPDLELELELKRELENIIKKWPKGAEILNELQGTGNKLSLVNYQLNNEYMTILATHPCFAWFETLNLENNSIGDQGAIVLAQSLTDNQVLKLNLVKNKIGTVGAIVLAQVLLQSQIQELFLNSNKIGDNGIKAIAKALANKSQVKVLGLYGNEISHIGAKALADVLPKSQVGILGLGYNNLGLAGVTALADSLPESQVYDLDIPINQIGLQGASVLARSLSNSKSRVRTLNLFGNQIGDQGAKYLADILILSTSQILILNLGDNKIGVRGATDLAEALPQSKLIRLLLHKNPNIGDRGVQVVGNILSRTQIKHIDLSNNQTSHNIQQLLKKQNPQVDFCF
ncbi:MAG: hypothetical protein BGO68_04125 [Candidatus Amoebophilus sp. 36-38]|nr:MAG: hypothetical protein BGO68_04125 [Candidatus Amoebophilus sp. 36-38]